MYEDKHKHEWQSKKQTETRTRPQAEVVPTPELIASFENLPIPQAEPTDENTPAPPCRIATLPSKVLVKILGYVALKDPSAFGRMALVCKRMAYHFAHEQDIWKQVCQSSKFGFPGMHYDFACDLLGQPISTNGPRHKPFPLKEPAQIPKPLLSWAQVFQTIPRIRYTGVYISSVDHFRDSDTRNDVVTWTPGLESIRYYRYLRFYPNGSVISLQTCLDPDDIVRYINEIYVKKARAPKGKALPYDPNAPAVPKFVMKTLKHAYWGRWHLAPPVDTTSPSTGKSDQTAFLSDERDVMIETEGDEDSKYIYTMHLSLRSSPQQFRSAPYNGSKNTNLIWKDFWSHRRRDGDFHDFGPEGRPPFVFQRMKGWGLK